MRALWIGAIAALIGISVWQLASALSTSADTSALGVGLILSAGILGLLYVARRRLSRFLDRLESLDKRLGFHRSKQFDFELDGKPATLVREWWTGWLALIVGGETFELRRRYRVIPAPFRSRWSLRVGPHDVVVEAEAKPGVPTVTYRVSIAGTKVAETRL